MVTKEQVTRALISIANKQGRPFFDLITIREVLDAIRNNKSHPLKNTTMQELFLLYSHLYYSTSEPTEEEKDLLVEKLKKVKSFYSGQKQLLSIASVSERTIAGIISRDRKITTKNMNRLMPHLDQLIKKLEIDEAIKADFPHGIYTSYRKYKCRCKDCRNAWLYYANNRKKIRESEKRKNSNPSN